MAQGTTQSAVLDWSGCHANSVLGVGAVDRESGAAQCVQCKLNSNGAVNSALSVWVFNPPSKYSSHLHVHVLSMGCGNLPTRYAAGALAAVANVVCAVYACAGKRSFPNGFTNCSSCS